MIGNVEDARLIYQRRKSGNGPLPKGWRKIGGGTFRQAYLSPEGVVYKVCRNMKYQHKNQHNQAEYNHWLRIRQAKLKYKGWRINPVHQFKFMDGHDEVVVNASKFVEGKMDDPDEFGWGSKEYNDRMGAIDTAFRAFGLVDGHEGNYVRTKRGRVIIDVG